MTSPTRRIVLVGGGHAHVGVLRRLADASVPDIALTLVSPTPFLDYSGMLPGQIAGHYAAGSMQIDLRRLARAAGATFLETRATGLDAARRRLSLANGPPLAFDVASLDIGSAPPQLAGDETIPVIPVKPVDRLMAGIETLERQWSDHPRPATLAVVGGGAGGIELTLSLAHRLAQWPCPPRLKLICRNTRLLPGAAPAAARRLARELDRAGVAVVRDAAVTKATAQGLLLADGRRLAADAVFCATGARAPTWLAETGLATDEQGFLRVDWTLASISHPGLFAAGDIAALPAPRPKSGVFAVRQAPVLADNLQHAARGTPGRCFKAPRSALALISLGDRRALAVRGRWALGPSRLLWRLKDRIDRRFIARLHGPC